MQVSNIFRQFLFFEQDFLKALQEQWLGCWKSLMIGPLVNVTDTDKLKQATTSFLRKYKIDLSHYQVVKVVY